jgi:hypothetical protein
MLVYKSPACHFWHKNNASDGENGMPSDRLSLPPVDCYVRHAEMLTVPSLVTGLLLEGNAGNWIGQQDPGRPSVKVG